MAHGPLVSCINICHVLEKLNIRPQAESTDIFMGNRQMLRSETNLCDVHVTVFAFFYESIES